MDISQNPRFNGPYVVAETASKNQTSRGEKFFHGAGEAAESGGAEGSSVAEASGAGDDSGLGDGSGAVVVGGKSEAGGGKFESCSGGGSGATSASLLRNAGRELPAGARETTCFFFGSFTITAGVKTVGLTFARIWSIRFWASELAADPGCSRITSL